jgi:5-methylcytosine-specific restriction endonuclease McrA
VIRRVGSCGSLDTVWRCQYVEEVGDANRKKSLHDVLRERRAAKPLLSVKELRQREASRRSEEAEAVANERVERWQLRQKSVDAEGKLAPEVYRAVFARNRRAYYGSRHWSRRTRAQLGLTSFCEVAGCRRADELQVRQLHYDAVGEEQAGRDLITLCQGCMTRAHKREQELGRPPAREELRDLDPRQPLYDAAAIAALKAKHRRALRRSDLEHRT